MFTMYLDKGCNKLKTSQDLKLRNDSSALWFRIEKGGDFHHLIKLILSIFSAFTGFFWMASSGGSGSPKILDIKRAFGAWSIPKKDIVSKHEIYDANGEKLFSDIARVVESNSGSFVELLSRQLFGIDSALFFLPNERKFPADKNIINALDELLIKRNTLSEITESLQKCRLIESYIDEVIGLDGIAIIVLRDSDMTTFFVAIGNQFLMKGIWQNMENTVVDRIDESELLSQLGVGVSVSVLS